MEVGAQ